MTAAPAEVVTPVAAAPAAPAPAAAAPETPGTPGTPAPAAQPAATPAAAAAPVAPPPAAEPAKDPAAKPAAEVPYEIKADGAGAVAGKFAEFAKAAGIPLENAQKGFEAVAAAFAEHQQKQVADMRAQWQAEVAADPKLGGDNLAQTKAFAARARALAPEGFSDFLDKSGLGDEPRMVAWAAAIGRHLSPDTFETGTRTAPKSLSLEERLYPTRK